VNNNASNLVDAFISFPKPIIAAVNGPVRSPSAPLSLLSAP
jgi:hypothetical protein